MAPCIVLKHTLGGSAASAEKTFPLRVNEELLVRGGRTRSGRDKEAWESRWEFQPQMGKEPREGIISNGTRRQGM